MAQTPCMLCGDDCDDVLLLGTKYTFEDVTAHYYCLLLSSDIEQSGKDDEGIKGFMPNDIKTEMKRTRKMKCYICGEKGANIKCCKKSCKLSFHLLCGLKSDCQSIMNNEFESYCGMHVTFDEPKDEHSPRDLCQICHDKMGHYVPMQSIPSPCCNADAWYHKQCLAKFAQTCGDEFKCPLCNNYELFRETIESYGILIPFGDAKWEESIGPNAFYDYQQHFDRPTDCAAKLCKCPRGRKYHSKSSHKPYTFTYCDCCGANGVHNICLTGARYVCNICKKISGRKSIQLQTIDTSKQNMKKVLNQNKTNDLIRRKSRRTQPV